MLFLKMGYYLNSNYIGGYARKYNIIFPSFVFANLNGKKYTPNLELYIHFPHQKHLQPYKNNKYSELILTEKPQILNAYFGTLSRTTVQADAPATEDNPTTQVTHYQKLDKALLGETVYLIAECPNLDEKTVTFQVFEKTPLLEAANTALTLLYKDKPQTRIEVHVQEGFAVAEVKLQKGKEAADNEEWEQKLDPDKGKVQVILEMSNLGF